MGTKKQKPFSDYSINKDNKEKTKTELHNLDSTTNLDSLEKNIAKNT